jgi:hypothetical protein
MMQRTVMAEPSSTIKLTENTKNRLLQIGKMGDTYEDVIKRLLDFYDANRDEG